MCGYNIESNYRANKIINVRQIHDQNKRLFYTRICIFKGNFDIILKNCQHMSYQKIQILSLVGYFDCQICIFERILFIFKPFPRR